MVKTEVQRPQTGEESSSLVEVRNLTFTYEGAPEPIIQDLSLEIGPGELIVLTGPSGSGKSTLCRHFNGIVPHLSTGEIIAGQVFVKGMDVSRTRVHKLSSIVGMVQQDPESQMVCLGVKDEIAFGPENLGLSHDEVLERVNKVVEQVQLQDLVDLLTLECSGGQKQRVAIGSALALYPDLLIMDEPTTDLDPVGAHQVVSTILRLRDTLGITFLVVEHDLDELIDVADRLIVMDGGRIVMDGVPSALLRDHYQELVDIGLRIPQHIAISRHFSQGPNPISPFSIQRSNAVASFASWVETLTDQVQLPQRQRQPADEREGPMSTESLRLTNVSFSYDGLMNAVEDVSLEIHPGEFVAVVGANGSGKSTLARLVLGLLPPDEGEISVLGINPTGAKIEDVSQTVGFLFQNPDTQLFNFTVESEVGFGMKVRNRPEEEIQTRTEDVLRLLSLETYAERHPFSLSRGERQRLAFATVLVADPDVIILDEPTTGQDRKNLNNLIQVLEGWIDRKGAIVLMIAHDMGLVCERADRTIVMADGRIVLDGPTEKVFGDHFASLRDVRLLPPAVVEVSYPFVGSKLSRVLLSLDEFYSLVGADGG